jgi:hypothetical protein
VLLFPISHSTPTGYDFPELRKSLAGHPEYAEVSVIETEDNGARYVGATVADFQQGSAFAKLAQKSLSSAKPSVLCAQPKPVREIPIAWSGTEPAQATAP